MQYPGNVRVDLVAGQGPGQLQAVICFVGDDGTVHEQSDPMPLTAGNSLNFGPLLAEYAPAAKWGYDKTPEPPKKNAAGSAAAGKSGSSPTTAAGGRR